MLINRNSKCRMAKGGIFWDYGWEKGMEQVVFAFHYMHSTTMQIQETF